MTTINFKCGGGFFSYYLGIAQYIYEHYVLDDCIFYCTSAGVSAAVPLAFNISPKRFFFEMFIPYMKLTNKLFPTTFLNWKTYGSKHWKFFIENSIEDENFQKNKHKLFIQVYDICEKKSYYKNNFSSKYELTQYINATYTIPFVLTKIHNCAENVDNHYLIDGGFGRTSKECDIIISPDIFGRKIKLIDYWPTTDYGKNIESLHMGYEDAKKNSEFFNKLKLKSLL
jgi:hypothetical protein